VNAISLKTEDAREVRESLILEHLPQVRLIARRIHERLPESVSLDDLVSSGILGLIAAIDNFDPAHNVKLRTYAEYKIRGAILDSLRKLDWASRDRRRKTKQIEAATLSVEQRLHRAAAEEEIAVELHLDLREFREWQLDILGLNLNSLDYSYDREDGRNVIDTVADKEEHWPSNLLESRELERVLAAGMKRMPEVERIVLHRYYQEDLTLREIAQGMNLNLSRISQLKSQAILRLRSFLGKRWPTQHGG
jgi:RNA polymerase sigma factor for flagellar operon FliA